MEKIVWPGWTTVRLLGRGSFGAVYEIERRIGNENDVEKAAVKEISIPQSQSDIEEMRLGGYDDKSVTAHFQGIKDRIEQEYIAMAKLKGAVNIVYCDDIRSVQHDDGFGWDVYIKMELLTPLMNALKPLDEAKALKIGTDLCRALVMCGRVGIVHRDIKPQNIFVSRDWTCKLGDFGVARTMDGTSSASVRTGTYDYMAPEVYNGQHYGARADLYSLGMVMYWLLNDCVGPFLPRTATPPTMEMKTAARDRRFRGEKLPPPAHGGAELKGIVLKACAFDPQERYQSAEEMLRDLEKLAGGSADAPAAHVGVDAPLQSAVRPTAPPAGEPLPDEDGTVSAFGRHMSTPADAPLRSAMRPTASPAGEPLPDEDATVTSSVYTPKAKKTAPTAGKTKEFPLWIKIFDVLAVAAILLIVLLPKGGSKANIDPLLNAAIQSNSPTASPAVEIVQIRFDTMELSEFTTYPGEMLTLNAYVSPQTITDKVKWSSDDKDEEYFTITVDKDDGNKVTVECLKYSETPLKLYAEIFGKKVECVIRFRKA